jgi:hypothetical protein
VSNAGEKEHAVSMSTVSNNNDFMNCCAQLNPARAEIPT